MNPDFVWPKGFDLDIEFGYLNPAVVAPKRHNPRVVLNTDGTSVLRTVREELGHCESFLFSVAFVTPRAIALLKQELVDCQERGTRGSIVTSDYLASTHRQPSRSSSICASSTSTSGSIRHRRSTPRDTSSSVRTR